MKSEPGSLTVWTSCSSGSGAVSGRQRPGGLFGSKGGARPRLLGELDSVPAERRHARHGQRGGASGAGRGAFEESAAVEPIRV